MKKVVPTLLATLLVFSGLVTTSASAAVSDSDEPVVKFENGQIVEINNESNEKVSEETLESIAEQAASETDDKDVSITIHKVSSELDNKVDNESEEDEVDSDKSNIELDEARPIQAMGIGYTDRVTSKKVTRWSVVGAAKQITSVARGATKKFTTSNRVTATFSTNVSGGVKGLQSSVASELTNSYHFKSELTYKGPKSPYVSRVYYVTPYYNHGTWKGYRDWWIGGKDYYSGSFREYDSHVEWSRDIK